MSIGMQGGDGSMKIRLLACLAMFFQFGNINHVFAESSVVVSVVASRNEAGWCINYRPMTRKAFAEWFKSFAQQYGSKATIEIECYHGVSVADFVTVASILQREGFMNISVSSISETYSGGRPKRLDAIRLKINN